jgi:hypothetical protein
MAITSRLRKSSSKECGWTRYIKRPASIIPASRFDSSPRILPGSTDILTHFDVSRILETWKFPSLLSWRFKRLERSEAIERLERLERTNPQESKEYRQCVGIARGSAGEVCYQLLLARELNYISNESYQELRSGYDRVIQMLLRLSQSLGNEPRARSR